MQLGTAPDVVGTTCGQVQLIGHVHSAAVSERAAPADMLHSRSAELIQAPSRSPRQNTPDCRRSSSGVLQ
eukprot:917013-Rhodomonas_salina.2